MSKYVYDVESDGLLDAITTIWCLVLQDVDTEELFSYSDYDDDLPSLAEGLKRLQEADLLVAHNGIGYDVPAIKIVTGIDLMDKKHHDTLIMSRVNRYKRPFTGHSLKAWGEHLGDSKIQYDDWTQYSKQMLEYCQQDVKLNLQVYRVVLEEFKKLNSLNPLYAKGMRVEHEIAKIQVGITEQGWNFDVEKANETYARMASRMQEIEDTILPHLGTHKVYLDKEPKTPKYKKDGTYTAVTARILTEYFGRPILAEDALLPTPPAEPGQEFKRFKIEQITLGQTDLVKEWLLSIGWKPDEYNRKLINGRWQSTGPKFTTTSLTALGSFGVMIDEYYTIRNRRSVLESWLEATKEGRLHGNMFTIGTPSFRCRHSVIVNIPGIEAAWGKEMRELFRADDGDVLVGADSSGNQLRGLVHYVNNPEYTDVVINGDQHQRNADFLGCTRSTAKSYLYAYLFGAGDAKLGQVLSGKSNKDLGKRSKQQFAKGITGLDALKKGVEGAWSQREVTQGQGWIFGLDGRPLFVPSQHQCLNYLLQCAEGITCKAATVWAMEKIKEEGLRAKIRIFYHDEMQISSHPEDAERVQEIAAMSFREAPKDFGVMVMDGDGCRGATYAETH